MRKALRPVRAGAAEGTAVTGEATPVRKGRTTQVWQTRVTGADGGRVALVTQTPISMARRGCGRERSRR